MLLRRHVHDVTATELRRLGVLAAFVQPAVDGTVVRCGVRHHAAGAASPPPCRELHHLQCVRHQQPPAGSTHDNGRPSGWTGTRRQLRGRAWGLRQERGDVGLQRDSELHQSCRSILLLLECHARQGSSRYIFVSTAYSGHCARTHNMIRTR